MSIFFKKLNSNCGASIILALIFFLVCTVIGSIVLFTAYSNAGRLSHMKEEQQVYLTVSSAASLVRDELDEQQYIIENKKINDAQAAEYPKVTTPAEGALAELLNKWAAYVYNADPSMPSNEEIVVKAASLNLEDVKVIFSMDLEYRIKAVFSTLSDSHKMTLSLSATKSSETTQATEYDADNNIDKIISTEITTIKWYNPIITKGGA